MMLVHLFGQTATGPADPAKRGYHVAYQDGEANRCPGCGRSHWHVGRVSAECAFCSTALPLADPGTNGAGVFRLSKPPLVEDAA